MRRLLQGLAAGTAFTVYAAIGAAAFAQPPAPPPESPSQAGVSPPRPAGQERIGGESQAERAERLRDILQLKPAQEPALQAFVAALDTAHGGATGRRTAGPPPATTPERMARMQQMMAQHQSAMTAVIDATRRFYDQLDPAQKRAFDALPPTAMRRGMGATHGMPMRVPGGDMGGGRMGPARGPGGA